MNLHAPSPRSIGVREPQRELQIRVPAAERTQKPFRRWRPRRLEVEMETRPAIRPIEVAGVAPVVRVPFRAPVLVAPLLSALVEPLPGVPLIHGTEGLRIRDDRVEVRKDVVETLTS